MFGSIAIFGSKGMVRVPSITGSLASTANSLIQGAGLKAVNSGTVDTNDSNLNGKVASQNPAANTLVNYETNVSYSLYNYVAPPPTCTPQWIFSYYGAWSDWSTCSGGTQSRSRAVYGYYQYSDCSTSGTQQYDTQTESQSCTPPAPCGGTVGQSCVISYSCATVGCSFCCPDFCYKSGTINSSCVCANPVGSYFC